MMFIRKLFSLSNLTLLMALTLSGIAAWYSVVGLTAIFAAAVTPIIIMGASLEAAKVVTTIWLHRFWYGTGILIKLYLIPAVLVLALITSMGIFGFLSKAHLDQAKPAGNNVAKIERIDLQVAREQRIIADSEKVISQLDKAVQVLLDNDRIRGPDGALAVRKSQQGERDTLASAIAEAQSKIDKLEDEKFELNVAVRDLELEVGPIKYVAELVYGDAHGNLEKAVRGVILLLVIVFDPLALCLVIAALKARSIEFADIEKKYAKTTEIIPPVESAVVEDTSLEQPIEIVEDNQPDEVIEEIIPKSELTVVEEATEETVEKTIQEPVEEVIEDVTEEITPVETIEEVKKNFEEVTDEVIQPAAYNIQPVPQEIATQGVTKKMPYEEKEGGYVVYDGKLFKKEALKEIHPDLFSIKADSIAPVHSNFGTTFPKFANKGDVFVRVDVLPNRVFKFDGVRWIELNKDSTDTHLFDTEYLKFLISKISTGEYDIEALAENERYQLEEYLKSEQIKK